MCAACDPHNLTKFAPRLTKVTSRRGAWHAAPGAAPAPAARRK